MPRFRCDFEVKSDFALTTGVEQLITQLPSGHQLTIRNDALDEAGNVTGLMCSVVGQADDIEGTHKEFREYLARYLDVLSFATQASFMIEKVLRLMDWEAGDVERRMKIFGTFPTSYPPDLSLDADYLATVQELEGAGIPDFTRVALKYFRYAFLERSPEDQFMRFWLALEVIAESTKPSEVVPVPCADCGAAMKCATCGAEPHRRPMANEAIRLVVRSIVGDVAPAVLKRQFAARNGIMHGRSVESIEKDCKATVDAIVDELAAITWQAVARTIKLRDEGGIVVFGYRDSYASKTLTVAMLGGFEHKGDGDHPSEDKLPTGTVSITSQESPARAG